MGYYTYYELSLISSEEIRKASCIHDFPLKHNYCPECGKPVLALMNADDYAKEIETIIGYNPFEDRNKWYDHEKDMKRISRIFRNIVFRLDGDGEESGDIWVKYFKNGKMQVSKAIIKLDEYDESKLS